MRNAGAEVVFIWAIPKFAAQAIKFIHDSGWKPAIIMTSVSADPTVIKDAGTDAAEGVITAGYAPQYDDDSNQDIQFIKKTMAKYAPGAEINNFTVYGFSVASVMVETLKRAGNDLTRQGLVKAAESIKDFQPLATLGKATMTPNDHTPLHCMKLEKVQNGEYVYFGDLICSEVKQ
jgi:branched-chain amino acid transport system substrate-binding protein